MEFLVREKLEFILIIIWDDKSVEVEAYYKSDASTYVSLWQEFNLNDLQFQIDIKANITVLEKLPIIFNKVYRQIVKEP